MNIKRIFSLLLALSMVLALASCGKKKPAPTPDASASGSDASSSIVIDDEADGEDGSEEEELDVDENGYAIEDGVIIGFVSDATETVTPADVDTIADAAFSSDFGFGVNLEKVRITSNIKYIEDGAFSFTAADDIYMEEGVESIGSYAFSDSYITDIWFPASITDIGVCIMETEEGLSGCTIHVVKDSPIAKYFEEDMPYGDATLAYDYQ